jgi:hypothetical protein
LFQGERAVPEFFESRKLRYEIHTLSEKRWQIAEIVDDGRSAHCERINRSEFEEVERGVLDKANALLAAGEFEAVRVLREREREDGFATTSEIFFREASAGKGEAPVTVSRYDGPMSPCATPEELYSRRACKVIGISLRAYLDRQLITALELVHFYPYIRKLNDCGSLVQAALHQTATAQVRTSGGDLKTRLDELQNLIAAVETNARDAMAERRLPVIAEGQLDTFAECIKARYEGAARRFFTVVAIARHFQGSQSTLAKLDFALDALVGKAPDAMAPLLDEFAAGCLDGSQLVMDLLGHQPNLAAALLALAALARGDTAADNGGAPSTKLRSLIAAGRLPLVVDGLWDRIAREFSRGRPLSRQDDKQEWDVLIKTADELLAVSPEAHKGAIVEAVTLRKRRIREAALLGD